MAPQQLRNYGVPNNMPNYGQYPQMGGGHVSNLPPPGGNPSFMTQNSSQNPFNGSLSLAQGFSGGAGGGGIGAGIGLASHDAQMRFHGGNMQPQSTGGSMYDGSNRGAKSNKNKIREVWKSNLAEEFEVLRNLVDKFPYVAMVGRLPHLGDAQVRTVLTRRQDTEFPGVVARPMGSFRGKSDYHYQTLRSNVDLLKLIQLGITLFDEEGRMVPERQQSQDSAIDMEFPARAKGRGQYCTWQFNFQFSLSEDMYSEQSIQSLKMAGVDFAKHETDGINVFDFGALLQTSGLVCFDHVHWISFHGGYDFGYLTKLLMREPLPDDEVEFDKIMRLFFRSSYDVKYLMKHAIKTHNQGQLSPVDPNTAEILAKFESKSSLEHLAEILRVDRLGRSHNGGSDSYVTGKVFFEMKRRIYNGEIRPEHLNKVWGLGLPEFQSNHVHSTPQHFQQLQENSTPGNTNGTPSTPNNAHAGLAATTPAHSSVGVGGPSTPGGQFGHFSYRP